MDNYLSSEFGNLGLSSAAREWRPIGPPQQQQQQQQQHPQQQLQQQHQQQQPQRQMQVPLNPIEKTRHALQSNSHDWQQNELDLNYAVKEFVPGRGWTTKGPSGSIGSSRGQVKSDPSFTDIFGSNPSQPKPPYDQGMQRIVSEPSTVPSGPAPPPFRSLHSLGLSDDNWRYYRDLKIEESRQMDPSDPRHKAIPMPYCNAFCLDPPNRQNSRSSFGYPAATFQVVNRDDGHLYCLRRFDNVKSVNPKIASTIMEQWGGIEHPGIATLHQCFVSQRAVFFVHQYIPGTQSFLQVANPPTLSEPVIWSAICQMVTVIRRVHGSRLALRTLDLRHTLLQMDALRLRVFLNCMGIIDALEFESRKSLHELQAEDMRNFGRWILSIVTGTNITISTDPQTLQNCERYCMQNYSRELRHFILTLIRSQNPPSILDVSRVLSGRLMDELDSTQLSLLRTEKALSGEYESGRALRLLLKLGFVNERPENGGNRRWSQSGDCYVLTLFRDYVFHQADGAGQPIMNLGHVITALNKLDAADEEKIVLSSRDGKSLMVVSYADVARCLDSTYHELCSGSAQSQSSLPLQRPPY